MTARTTTILLAGTLVAATAAPLASHASAQEAIMLESIGAVRMVAPEELQRRDAEAARQQHPEQLPHLPRQHAEVLR